MKIPKGLRKGRAAKFLASPLGAAILADVLVAAGAVAVAKEAQPGSAVRRVATHAREEMETLASEAKARGHASGDALKEAFAAASAAFAERLRNTAEAIEQKKAEARDPSRAAH